MVHKDNFGRLHFQSGEREKLYLCREYAVKYEGSENRKDVDLFDDCWRVFIAYPQQIVKGLLSNTDVDSNYKVEALRTVKNFLYEGGYQMTGMITSDMRLQIMPHYDNAIMDLLGLPRRKVVPLRIKDEYC